MEQKGTLKYRKLQRTPQSGENAGKKKWYATAVTDREVDFEGFVSHISDHGSPYSRGTIHGVLMDALDHLQELILDGKSVRLSDLGLFSIGMTSKAEDTKEKVTAASVGAMPSCARSARFRSTAAIPAPTRVAPLGVPQAALNRAATPVRAAPELPEAVRRKAAALRITAAGLNKALA